MGESRHEKELRRWRNGRPERHEARGRLDEETLSGIRSRDVQLWIARPSWGRPPLTATERARVQVCGIWPRHEGQHAPEIT